MIELGKTILCEALNELTDNSKKESCIIIRSASIYCNEDCITNIDNHLKIGEFKDVNDIGSWLLIQKVIAYESYLYSGVRYIEIVLNV